MIEKDVRRVSDIMTKEVITARAHESVSHVHRVMRDKKIHAIPVLDDFDRLLGILTPTDLVRRVEGARTTVGSVMTRRVFVLPPEANLLMLVKLMKRWRLHHVVICEEVGKVLGIVSSYDLLDLVEEQFSRPAPEPSEPKPSKPKPSGSAPSKPKRPGPRPVPKRREPPPEVKCVTEDPLATDMGLVFLDTNPAYEGE